MKLTTARQVLVCRAGNRLQLHDYATLMYIVFTGRKVAVKVINLTKENETYIREEYRALRDLPQHENLPEFYGIFLKKGRKENEEVWLVMEVRLVGQIIRNIILNTSHFCDKKKFYRVIQTQQPLWIISLLVRCAPINFRMHWYLKYHSAETILLRLD